MVRRINLLSPADVASLPDFQAQPPDNIKGQCSQCGKCCQSISCPALDPISLKCLIHHCRPVACRIWPQTVKDIDSVRCTGYKLTGL